MRVKLPSGKELGVFITHIRPEMTDEQIEAASPFTKEAAKILGGPTYSENGSVAIIMDGETELGVGVAKCVDTDVFSKKVGLRLALTRALQKSGLEKGDRRIIWDEVFSGKYTKTKSNYFKQTPYRKTNILWDERIEPQLPEPTLVQKLLSYLGF